MAAHQRGLPIRPVPCPRRLLRSRRCVWWSKSGFALDHNVNAELTSWHIPRTSLTRRHPVTLRRLLSMTAGINVPGYVGYRPGETLPTLVQILDGSPPANSPPVRVAHTPGAGYAYSGGSYEIVQALMQDTSHQSFAELVKELVLQPLEMNDSFFGQQPRAPGEQMATGHLSSGAELPGDWRAMPEMAAGGLWSTPTDLARLLIGISKSYKGGDDTLLSQAMTHEMLKQQSGGPYGLGAAVSGSGRALVLMKRGQNVRLSGLYADLPRDGPGHRGHVQLGQRHDTGNGDHSKSSLGVPLAASRRVARLD